MKKKELSAALTAVLLACVIAGCGGRDIGRELEKGVEESAQRISDAVEQAAEELSSVTEDDIADAAETAAEQAETAAEQAVSAAVQAAETAIQGTGTAAQAVTEALQEPFVLNPSPDKYTQYINRYIGRNAASVGYTSMGGDRMDRIGQGYIELVLVAEDGSFVDPEDEEGLKQYVVTAQSPAPNTEVHLTFEKDSEGNEFDSLVEDQSCEQVVLALGRVGEPSSAPPLTEILLSPDKYTKYMRDYVGRNLGACGYTSLGGELMDAYGNGHIRLVVTAQDGSYIDPEDEDSIGRYVVTGQSWAPNTQITLAYEHDADGSEYSSLVAFQSIEQVFLSAAPVGESADPPQFTQIRQSPDKYTQYIRDYRGQNLASVGYTSLGGQKMDSYGSGYLQLNIAAEDGSFVDPEDEEQMAGYVVTGQDLAPDTELTLTFMKNSDGTEYDGLVDSQNYESILLTVRRID